MNRFVSTSFIVAATSGILLASSAGWAAGPTAAASPYTDISSWTDISTYSAYLVSPSARAPTNSATIIQDGSNNTATSDATVPSSAGTGSYYGNITVQAQIGNNNVSNVAAVGDYNTLVTTQAGDNNTTSITAYGSNNSLSSTQIGSNLSYTLQELGSHKSISVLQRN